MNKIVSILIFYHELFVIFKLNFSDHFNCSSVAVGMSFLFLSEDWGTGIESSLLSYSTSTLFLNLPIAGTIHLMNIQAISINPAMLTTASTIKRVNCIDYTLFCLNTYEGTNCWK